MQGEHTDVVLFFDDLSISKEMLVPEFEAVLDHVVSMPELEGQRVNAAYVRVGAQLQVNAVVLFTLSFDDAGVADPKWNLPLEHLATNSSTGPDLGGGRIRLACFSQCPIPWHQKQLWDPVMSPSHNTLVQIRNAITSNKLGLECVEAATETPAPPALSMAQSVAAPRAAAVPQLQSEQRDRIAQLIKSQRLHIATLKNKRAEDRSRLKQEFQKQLSRYDRRTGQLEQQCKDHQARAERFKSLLDKQVQNIKTERERFSLELQAARSADGNDQLAKLQQQFSLELQARVDAETVELKEMLEKRNVELFYREEQMTGLREEIAALRQERVRLLNQGASSYLEQLADAGVDFVAHHDGVGHLSIAASEVGEYLSSPQEFAAQKCGVSLQHYQQWLEHVGDPVCQAQVTMDGDGESFPCGRQVATVDNPSQFVAQYNDRCPEHQHQPCFTSTDAINDSVAEQQEASQRLRRGA